MKQRLKKIGARIKNAALVFPVTATAVLFDTKRMMCDSGFDSLADNQGMVNIFNKAAPVYAGLAWLPGIYFVWKYLMSKSDQKAAGHYKGAVIAIVVGYVLCGIGAVTLSGLFTDVKDAFSTSAITTFMGC